MGDEWTVEAAAALLSVKPSEVTEVGTRYGHPSARTRDGVEYLWADGVLHVVSKSESAWEREKGEGPQYAGLAVPRYVPTRDDLGEASDDDGDPETSDDDPHGLDAMTKKELVAFAAEHSIEVNPKAKNADLVAAISSALDDDGDPDGS